MSFPRYPSYKDSGVECLGEVPGHWNVSKLKRHLAFLTSGSRGWAEHYAEDGPLFIRIGNLTRDGINLDLCDIQRVSVPSGAEGERTRVSAGDLLFSITAFLGSVAVVPEDMETAYVSQHVALARLTKGRLLPKWAAYVAISLVGKIHLESQGYGGTKIQLSLDDVANMPITMPPDSEQREITTFLDRETAKIDALRAEQRLLIELLKEKRQAVISHAVTKGLNPDAPMKDSGVEWLGEVPEHWHIKPLKLIMEVLRGQFTHRPRNDPEYYDGDYPFIQTGDISGSARYITDYKQTLNERGASVSKEFPRGTLVMAIAANVGDVAILDFAAYFPDSIVGLIPSTESCLLYLYFLIGAMKHQMQVTATMNTQLNINTQQISSLIFPAPPQSEQSIIAAYLCDVTAKLDALTAEAEKSITLLQERRTALISAAVTGKIDVRGCAQ